MTRLGVIRSHEEFGRSIFNALKCAYNPKLITLYDTIENQGIYVGHHKIQLLNQSIIPKEKYLIVNGEKKFGQKVLPYILDQSDATIIDTTGAYKKSDDFIAFNDFLKIDSKKRHYIFKDGLTEQDLVENIIKLIN